MLAINYFLLRSVLTCLATLGFTELNGAHILNRIRRKFMSGTGRVLPRSALKKSDLLGALRLRDRCLFLLCQNSWCTRGIDEDEEPNSGLTSVSQVPALGLVSPTSLSLRPQPHGILTLACMLFRNADK